MSMIVSYTHSITETTVLSLSEYSEESGGTSFFKLISSFRVQLFTYQVLDFDTGHTLSLHFQVQMLLFQLYMRLGTYF